LRDSACASDCMYVCMYVYMHYYVYICIYGYGYSRFPTSCASQNMHVGMCACIHAQK
jgi:hypothetical protein